MKTVVCDICGKSKEHLDLDNKAMDHFKVENLEWCTGIENKEHAYINGLRKSRAQVPVEMFSIDGEFICKFPSVATASRITGIHGGRISSCCNGKCKSVNGHVFREAVQNG